MASDVAIEVKNLYKIFGPNPQRGYEQVRQGLGGEQVVDADELDVLAAGFEGGAQHEPADSPETVDCNTDCHGCFPRK